MAKRERVTGWHFDPQDTLEQRCTLRSRRSAQLTRKHFPAGTRVQMDPKAYPRSTMLGTVTRHVPLSNAQGGYLVVQWDNGHKGPLGPINASRVED